MGDPWHSASYRHKWDGLQLIELATSARTIVVFLTFLRRSRRCGDTFSHTDQSCACPLQLGFLEVAVITSKAILVTVHPSAWKRSGGFPSSSHCMSRASRSVAQTFATRWFSTWPHGGRCEAWPLFTRAHRSKRIKSPIKPTLHWCSGACQSTPPPPHTHTLKPDWCKGVWINICCRMLRLQQYRASLAEQGGCSRVIRAISHQICPPLVQGITVENCCFSGAQ